MRPLFDAPRGVVAHPHLGRVTKRSSSRRPAKHLTPNTRFLNNIIRDTDNHNRALLAQERADSQARLRELEVVEERKRRAENERTRRMRPPPGDMRKRMLGDIAAIIGRPSKKRKADDDDEPAENAEPESSKRPKRPLREGHESRGKDKSRSRTDEGPRDDDPPRHRNARKELFAEHDSSRESTYRREDRERSRSRERRHRRDRPEESKSRRSDRDKDRGRHSSQADSGSDRTRQRRRSRDLFAVKQRRADTSMRLDPEVLSSAQESRASSDSDPLDDIIGPKPPSPVRRRGRGTTGGSSGIDTRFSSAYDPKADVALDHDDKDDDWGTSLEALRDRQRWKEQGADRLRAAGFTDDQVKKWEKGDEKNEEDVRWSKKGEQREWDRGKTLLAMEDGSEV